LACRAALAKLLGTNEIEITYSETGQPQIKGHCISFSHTKNTVAVALADIPVGIDIEELSPRILRLYSRFMSEEEMSACDLNNLQDLYYYWCAKEAMYKWFAKKNLDFIEDLQVFKNENRGVVCKKSTLQLFSFQTDNKIIVTAHKSIP
jgi:phosphopantetheinyl transferase